MHMSAIEQCNNSDPKGLGHRKFFLWQIGMKVLQFCFIKLMFKFSITFQFNSIYRFSAALSMSAFKGKANSVNIGSIILKSCWSFIELFSKQKNGLGILLNVLRINRVNKSQVWKVKKVMQFNYPTLKAWLWRQWYFHTFSNELMCTL